MKDKDLNLLSIENFIKDQYKFHVLFKMCQSKERIFYTDYENYIIGRSAKEFPIWIWTTDDISNKKIEEILGILDLFLDNAEVKITCKEKIYNKIKEKYNTTSYFEMGFLLCKKLNKVKISDGFIDKPNYSDKIVLANFWKDLCKEEDNYEVSLTTALIEVDNWLNSDNFYVWRNSLGEVVSMASFSVQNNQAKVSHVYTPPLERQKGYSKSLVYNVTKMILEQNLIPVLYTNYNYPISNDLYKKLGYESKGYLINFHVKR